MLRFASRLALPLLLAFAGTTTALAQAKAEAETEAKGPKFIFDTGETVWRGERIPLPPDFAPAMQWKGEEDIRFAPGMFQADADDFFSYVLVFLLEENDDDSADAIKREILAYYQGLAKAVLKGKDVDVDTEKFSITLEKLDTVTGAPASAGDSAVVQYKGTLDWTEPFATQQPQKLHFEAHAWKHGARPALFLCVSPQGLDHELWQTLRTIRESFRIED